MRSDDEKGPRVMILGVPIDPIDMPAALARMGAWIAAREAQYVCCAPAHAVMECVDHPELRAVYEQSGMTTPDGMPVVWLCRWYGFDSTQRVYGPDLLLAACAEGLEQGWRHYFYGGAPGVAERLAERLRERFPSIQIVGVESPPFRALSAEEDAQAVERLRRSGADIVWVGIGSPRQEQWMAAHRGQVGAPVLVGVGAAFDFLSGYKPQAPRWMQRSGLEWLFRLVSEPGRLWRRYVLGYPRFVVLVAAQLLRGRNANQRTLEK